MENYNDSQKLDLILELLEKQERRAKWQTVWTCIWIFFLIILPFYLTYKMISSIDLSAMTGMMENMQNAQQAVPQIDLSNIDINKALELLKKN